jgi:putative nucleotidyltransferase with HDIG domain
MPFRNLPFQLRIYILAHLPVTVLLLWQIAVPSETGDWRLAAALVVATILFSVFKTELPVFHGRITPSFATVCLALLLSGPLTAVLCAVAGATTGSFVRPVDRLRDVRLLSPPAYVVFYNVANNVLATAIGTLFFRGIHGALSGRLVGDILALTTFTLAYFAANSLGVSRAIAWQKGLPFLKVWKDNFLWTGLGFFASASVAAVIQAVVPQLGIRALLLLPLVCLLYYWHRLYLDRIRLSTEKFQQEIAHVQELNRLNQSLITSLAMAIEAKDDCTSSHIARVQHYAVALARDLGLAGPELAAVETGAIVHDIGKLGIPDSILGKPGKLTPAEYRIIQQHVPLGVRILAPVPFPFPVVDVVRTHHERWDGLGYPAGIAGEAIPLGGRIIAAVDVFDALTSDRPYRRALRDDDALRILQEGAGKQFDPAVVERFVVLLPALRAEIEALERALPPTSPADLLAVVENGAAVDPAAVAAAVQRVGAAASEHALASALGNACLELFPADAGVVYRENGAGDLLAVQVGGPHRERLLGLTIANGEGMAGWIARDGRSRLNVSAAGDIARRFGPEETVELSAAAGAAIKVGGQVLGVLAVYTAAYHVLTDHHLQVLELLAETAGMALERLEQQPVALAARS